MVELKRWLTDRVRARQRYALLDVYIRHVETARPGSDHALFHKNRLNGYLGGLWDAGVITDGEWHAFGREVDNA